MSDISNDKGMHGDSSNEKSMKVTDRRMFTPDGELREEYRHLEDSKPPAEASAARPAPAAREPEPPPERRPSERQPPEGRPPEGRPPGGRPAAPEPDPDAPGFMDLVSLLAENASVYLREASIPGADAPLQHLEVAKLHIDLLAVLKDKTAGNLSSQEEAVLEDVLYRLRMAYSSQRGF